MQGMSRIKPAELSEALGHGQADKRLQILRAVDAAGSISQAAREAGVSYKAAWQALDTLSNLAGAPLVEKVVGGTGGGGARLTGAGRQLLRAAEALARSREQVLARLARHPQAAGASALALRTSMRNQLPCSVERLRNAAGAIDVLLRLPGGQALSSRVTRESAQLLGLRAGLPVLALFKATAVEVGAGASAEPRAGELVGVVARSVRSAGEIALELAAGQRVVGFAAAGHGLARGASCTARVAPAAVVIALAG
jgi:molybdate transport system regulatory protein